jgi:hypothetical protein
MFLSRLCTSNRSLISYLNFKMSNKRSSIVYGYSVILMLLMKEMIHMQEFIFGKINLCLLGDLIIYFTSILHAEEKVFSNKLIQTAVFFEKRFSLMLDKEQVKI